MDNILEDDVDAYLYDEGDTGLIKLKFK